jgi:hypothetical protein
VLLESWQELIQPNDPDSCYFPCLDCIGCCGRDGDDRAPLPRSWGFVVSAPVLVVVKIELVRRVDELREMVFAATVHLLAYGSN